MFGKDSLTCKLDASRSLNQVSSYLGVALLVRRCLGAIMHLRQVNMEITMHQSCV